MTSSCNPVSGPFRSFSFDMYKYYQEIPTPKGPKLQQIQDKLWDKYHGNNNKIIQFNEKS